MFSIGAIIRTLRDVQCLQYPGFFFFSICSTILWCLGIIGLNPEDNNLSISNFITQLTLSHLYLGAIYTYCKPHWRGGVSQFLNFSDKEEGEVSRFLIFSKGRVPKKNPANYPYFVDKRFTPPPLSTSA